MKPIRSTSGFSLIELLAAMTLFAVVASALTASTVGTMKANYTSKQTAAASALIHDKIEQLRSLDPAANPADLQTGSHNDPLNPLTPLGQAQGAFTRTWAVTPNTPKVGLSQVAVSVSWTGSSGTRSVVGVTYVCRTASCN